MILIIIIQDLSRMMIIMVQDLCCWHLQKFICFLKKKQSNNMKMFFIHTCGFVLFLLMAASRLASQVPSKKIFVDINCDLKTDQKLYWPISAIKKPGYLQTII